MFWWYLAAALLTGCGRFAFDESTPDGAVDDDAPGRDAAPVTVTPPPDGTGKLFYQAIDGSAGNTSATVGVFTHAIALRMPPGKVTIHATGAGKMFADSTVMVMAGTNNSLTVIHGTD